MKHANGSGSDKMAHRPIRSLLIANRGEIACRIIRTCRERGIRTVAVYSEPDRNALHVRMADAAYPVGPAASSRSYLAADRILEAARRGEVDAVHPGYGFLSENADFAEACRKAGFVFVGPPTAAIRAMGDKTAARRMMREAGVPMAPGTPDAVDDSGEAALEAARIGYPVLIKAAAGGGGKGMRIVEEPAGFARAFAAAQSEAEAAFGDGRVYIETFVAEPRHIEFQILADAHGRTVHLFERECSIQRRHQKVIEEAPSSLLTPEQRAEMGAAAVRAAEACGYEGAGTVEFLVDRDGRFYFMEMNTRLQVEHPVTEAVTGLDLVAEQIRIAEGEPLGYAQADLSIRGHAVECRVYAEDPANGFLPDSGQLHGHVVPTGPGVRVDAGIDEGLDVLIHYDPMISKLITWAPTRLEAIDRMHRALVEYEIAGVRTTVAFCAWVMGHEAFRTGRFTTRFIERHFTPDALAPDAATERLAAVAAALYRAGENGTMGAPDPARAEQEPPSESRWRRRRWT